MLGNILLVFIALSLLGLLSVTSSPMPGGDRGMGYGLALFFCGAGFVVLTGLLAWNLNANNCFDWIPVSGGQRNGLVFVGWLAFAMATAASAMFKTEWHDGEFPQYLRWLSQAQAAIWLPLLILIPAVFLLNGERAPGHVPDWVKIPMMTGFTLSMLMGAGLLFGWMRASAIQNAANIEYAQNQNNEQHNKNLAWIAEQKATDPIVNILALTGRFHDTDVRDSAVAKVKSHPDWEAELIRLLSETEFDTETYHFIDGNKVNHPELFVEPINRSIRRIAKEIKKRITGASDLQDWHFEHFSIERILRAIDDQFLVPGADYRPAVQELLNALNTPKPEQFKNVKFTLVPVVDDWLKKH